MAEQVTALLRATGTENRLGAPQSAGALTPIRIPPQGDSR